MKWNDIFRLGQKKKTDSPKIVRVDYVGKKNQPALLYIPYGMFIDFPDDGLVGILADQGNEESLVALPTDIENREKLNPGEIALGIPALKNRLYFKDDESVSLENASGSVSIDKDGVVSASNANGSVSIDKDGLITITGAKDVSIASDANVIIDSGADITVTGAANITVDGGANTTVKAGAILTMETGDAATWQPNILPNCLFTGTPHGGVVGGIVKLKGA